MAHLKVFNLLSTKTSFIDSLEGCFSRSFVPEYFCLWPKANLLFQEGDTFQRREKRISPQVTGGMKRRFTDGKGSRAVKNTCGGLNMSCSQRASKQRLTPTEHLHAGFPSRRTLSSLELLLHLFCSQYFGK